MKIIEKSINDIKPYENNPRHNDNAVDAVAKSIKEFGFKQPIVIDKNNVIIIEHTRYKASIKLGMTTVPCVVAEDLTDKQVKALRLADNKTSELATWNVELLNVELLDLKDFEVSMADFGFEVDPIDELDAVEQDELPDMQDIEPICKLGDIWQLGQHRLVCGDCTDTNIVANLMDGKQADLIVTDPPYNVDYENVAKGIVGGHRKQSSRVKKGTNTTIKNDKLSDSQFYCFLDKAFSISANVAKDGCPVYVFYSSSESVNFFTAFAKHFVNYEQLIWVKNHFSLGHKDYHYRHEPIIYGYKQGAKHYFTNSRAEDTVIDDNVDTASLKKMNKDELLDLCKNILDDKNPMSVLYEDKPSNSDSHPTMKPVRLMSRLVRNSSRKNEIVLDPFGGSGSTLIVCEQLGRICYMIEIEPKYCDVIIARWENLTGQKAVKL